MPSREALVEDARSLSDQVLVERLQGEGLTNVAAEVTRAELSARGIDPDRALTEPRSSPPAPAQFSRINAERVRTILRRVLRFPYRAALGVEPLWAVALCGGALAFVTWKLVAWGIFQILGMHPIPPYARALSYSALGLYALVVAWWGISFWLTAGRTKAFGWALLGRIAALLCAGAATFGTLAAARIVNEFLLRFGAVG